MCIVAVFTAIGTKKSRKIMPKVEYIEEVDYAGGDYVIPQFKQSRQKNLQLLHNGYVYCRDSNRGLRV